MDLNKLLQIEGLRVEIFHWLTPYEASIACQACKLFLKFFQHDDYWKTKIDEFLCSSVPHQQLITNPCIRTFAQDRFGTVLCSRVDWLFSLKYKHSLTVFSQDFPVPSLWRYVYQVLVFMQRPQIADDDGLAHWIHKANKDRNDENLNDHYLLPRFHIIQRKLFAVYPYLRGLRPYLANDSSLASFFSEDPSLLYKNENMHRATSFIGCTTLYTFEKDSVVLRFITSNAAGGGGRYSATIIEIGIFQSNTIVQAVVYGIENSSTASMELIAVEQLSWSNFLVSSYPFQSLVTYLCFKELRMSPERPIHPAAITKQDPILPNSMTSKAFENAVKICAKLVLKQTTEYLPQQHITDLDNLFREKPKKRPSRTGAACVERLLRRIIARIMKDKYAEYSQLFIQQRDLELESYAACNYLTNEDQSIVEEAKKLASGKDSDCWGLKGYKAGLHHWLVRFPCETKSAYVYRQYAYFYPLMPHQAMFSGDLERTMSTFKFGKRYPPSFYAWASALLVPISKLVVFHLMQVTKESGFQVDKNQLKLILEEMDAIAQLFQMTPFKSKLGSEKSFLAGILTAL